MAKKIEKSEAPKTPRVKGAGIPEGFTAVSAAGGGAWFKPDSGATVYGELLGRFRKKKSLNGDPAYFYQVMLEKPLEGATRKVDDESVEVTLEPGDVVNLDERSATEELAPLVESGKRWRIFVEPLELVPIPGTVNSFWRMNVGKQEIIPGRNEPKVKPKEALPF